MAEQVQAAMDRMVAPLRDLLDRNIFTKEEIQAIVQRRQESEYLLRRVTARKADFLRYIEAEQLLEKLRKLRCIQRKRQEKEQGKENDQGQDQDDQEKKNNESSTSTTVTNKHIGDVHIVQHIHLLFTRAIRKFRSDLSLHLAHADFAKEQKSMKRLGKIYAEALQIFPRQVGLWIEAASQEYFGTPTTNNDGSGSITIGGGSIRNARVLFQRAVRINPQSEELWTEYFSLELHYAQRLKGRKQILLLGNQNADENDDHDADADDDNKNNDGDYYKIAKIILKNALAKIPDSIPFRMRILDTCKRFPETKCFMDMIQASLQEHFSDTPEAWIARAMYAAEVERSGKSTGTTKIEERGKEDDDEEGKTNTSKDHNTDDDESSTTSSNDDNDSNKRASNKRIKLSNPVISLLEEAIETLSTGEMYVQAFRFAQSYHNELEERENDNDNSNTNENAKREVLQFIDRLSKVPAHKYSSPELAMEQSEYFQSIGNDQAKLAIQVLEDYCNANSASSSSSSNSKKVKKTTPASLWIRWALLASSSVNDKNKMISIIQKGLHRTPMNDPEYYKLLLQLFGIQLTLALAVSNQNKQKSKTKENNKNNKKRSMKDESSSSSDSDSDDDDDDNEKKKNQADVQLMDTFQRILLLAPGREAITGEDGSGDDDNDDDDIDDDHDGNNDHHDENGILFLKSAAHACLKYLHYGYDTGGIALARRIYSLVLFQTSGALNTASVSNSTTPTPTSGRMNMYASARDVKYLKDFLDKCLKVEMECKDKKRLRRLYDRAIQIFQDLDNPVLEGHYRQQKNDKIIYQ